MSKKLIQAAAGAGGEPVYVDDVFSTYLYKGTSSTNNIVNNIDVSGEGGLIWLKHRVLSGASATLNQHHQLYDTERGATQRLSSNRTNAQDSTGSVMTFNSDGFTLAGSNSVSNNSSNYYASWTFRKQAGFFDVVTYTGNGTAGRTVSHNLGSVPGLVIIKSTNDTTNWKVWHRDLGNNWLELNTTSAVSSETYFPSSPTATELTLSGNGNVNGYGSPSKTYVAYLFAHDDQSFGDNSDESIIKCGSYSGNGLTTGNEITLGFEPQWLMVKRTDSTGYWAMMDIMRGITDSTNNYLQADSSAAEQATGSAVTPTATGFNILTDTSPLNNSSGTYIYIAIRRPMKTPEAGTEVYAADYQGNGTTNPAYVSGFVTDFGIRYFTPGGSSAYPITGSRLTGTNRLTTSSTAAQVSQSSLTWDYMNGWYNPDSASSIVFTHMFKRATGFFDVVAYEGNGSPSNTVRRDLKHNLGVTPELAILKRRDSTSEWQVGVNGTSLYLNLSNGSAGTYTHSSYFNATDFDVEGWVTEANNNVSGSDYIVYLFATLAGVSKVGSYTGTGSDINVDCGFSSAARFVLIKRTDASAGWIVFDSERGIVSGNDPYLFLNSTSAEGTTDDMIDPYSSGFTVHPNGTAINTSGGEYIFLAIA